MSGLVLPDVPKDCPYRSFQVVIESGVSLHCLFRQVMSLVFSPCCQVIVGRTASQQLPLRCDVKQ